MPMSDRSDSPGEASAVASDAHDMLRLVVFCAWALCAVAYFSYRLTVFNQEWPLYSWLFYITELHAQLSIALFAFVTWRVTPRSRPAPAVEAAGIDVMIPTKGEPLEVLRDTISAALAMSGRGRVLVLDDAARPDVRQMTLDLGAEYFARGESSHAKAGNLNFGLTKSTAPFVAVLDADFVAKPTMLQALSTYFSDPKCAFVQAPQVFSNRRSFQHLHGWGLPSDWNEQSLWFDVLERGRDHHNATAYCGCPAILRRSCLDEIGGFATGTVTEDAHTGLQLQHRGYGSAFHPDNVAEGQAPETLTAFMRQRYRWASGQLSVCSREGVWFGRGLTWRQTLCYWASLHYLSGALRDVVFVVAPAIGILFGILPVYADYAVFLPFFFALLFLSWAMMVAFSRGVWHLLPALHFDAAILAPHLLALWRAPFGAERVFHVTSKAKRQTEDLSFMIVPCTVAALNFTAVVWGFLSTLGLVAATISGTPLYTVWFWALLGFLSHFSVIWRAIHRTRRSSS